MDDDPPYLMRSDAYASLVDLMRRGRTIAPWSVLIVFEPGGSPAVYSNASASGLVPVLKEVTSQIEAGALLMPLSPEQLRWLEAEGSQALGPMGVADREGG